jgi:NhaA family Na+:H+ antiporter
MTNTPVGIDIGSALRKFLKSEGIAGILLIAAAALALIAANSPLHHAYHDLFHAELSPTPGITLHWLINDGLMAVFFLLVGLEIKREFLDGNLSSWDRRRLPLIAAAAGMAVPALLYFVIAGGQPELESGWAIPAATDIAFALGVLALLGSRVPTSLKLFLTTVAIADDLGAVALIAIFYTSTIDLTALAAAAAILAGLFLLGRNGVKSLLVFAVGAVLLWLAVMQSGVHATVAGVLAAAAVPLVRSPGTPDSAESPLHQLEHKLAPWVAFLILPLFGFANAGVALGGLGFSALLAPLPLAIAAGLFIGKQAGIFAAMRLSVRFGLAGKLRGATWLQIYGVALLCGIGFTMSLFIGALAFPGQPLLQEEAKIGILAGSFLSAIAGFAILRLAPLHPSQIDEEERIRKEIVTDGDVARLEDRKPLT